MHLLAVKTRAVSVWDHGPLSSNIMMVYGVLVALGIMLFVVYVPGVRACVLSPADYRTPHTRLRCHAALTDRPVAYPSNRMTINTHRWTRPLAPTRASA
jgi:hypothetical protein